jgi:glutamine amidotransferase
VQVAILDYGMCNLLNVARAFEAIEADVRLVASDGEAGAADRLVVPGVGAFRDSVAEVRARGYDAVIRNFIATGRPFLGICVGMQMLFDASEEFGVHEGLGILPGRVKAVPSLTTAGHPQRVPHIGWNALRPSNGRDWSGTLLEGCAGEEPEVYFVHSFAAVPERLEDRLADCDYGGHALCAAVQRDNVMATQFHPERSAAAGLAMLRRFVAM